MQDKKAFFDILSNVRDYNGTLAYYKNEQLLRALPHGESKSIVLAWLDSLETADHVDLEMVRYAAMICSSLRSLDEDVVLWIRTNPIENRFKIGLRFLSGFWAAGHKPSEISLAFVVNFAERDFKTKSDAYAYALLALSVVADPVDNMNITEQAQNELCQILLKHLSYLEENNLYPGIVNTLKDLKDFEKRKFFAIFDAAKDMDTSKLNGKVLSEAVDALVSWLDTWSKPGWFDQEHMFYAGRYLGSTGQPEFEQAVCKWVAKAPTQERLAITGAFFSGYWQISDTSPICIEFLQQANMQIPENTDAHKTITLALSIAAQRTQQNRDSLD